MDGPTSTFPEYAYSTLLEAISATSGGQIASIDVEHALDLGGIT